MNCRQTDFAWLVGIIEGEGSVRPQKNGSKYYKPVIAINMSCEDIIRRVHAVAGVGNVTGPHTDGNPNHKPLWFWRVHGRDALELLLRIRPYMGAKKTQEINETFRLLSEQRPAANAVVQARKKLTYEIACEIRRLRPQYSEQQLADMFGVSKGAISSVMLGRCWKPSDYETAKELLVLA